MENNKSKQPLVSFCIPTYNRCEKVLNLVKNILMYPGDDIQVIVSDNCSTDATAGMLREIDDDRFLFIRNNENIGAQMNQIKSLTLAEGEFAFFCLDKDSISHEGIGDLLKAFDDDTDVTFGYCALNINSQSEDVVYQKGLPSVLNMAYLSQHPSGLFYKTSVYNKLSIVKHILADKKHFPFYPDLINGAMAMTGKSRKINLPLVYTETKEECKTIASFTYTAQNAFFLPDKRQIEFDTYIHYAQQLNLSTNDLKEVVKKLYLRGLLASTLGYKNISADEEICAHHGMQTRNVGFVELYRIGSNFAKNFFCKQLPIGGFSKLSIILHGKARFFYGQLLSK